ncbi:hypothetical protein EON73_03325 [bacterium]|nr:MAG: hypothetical protein EON73_03325 [bacterium]
MRRQGSITAHWTPIRFDTKAGSQAGDLLGDFVVEGQSLLACAQTQYQDPATNQIVHEGVVFEKNLPALLERR